MASAGNGGEQGDHISYPAAYPGVIAVAAVDKNGTHASFSTRRWYATVSAPGVDVVIADPDRNYYEGWGTSAASAFVSGAVALVRSAYPGLTPGADQEAPRGHRPRRPRRAAATTPGATAWSTRPRRSTAAAKLKPAGLRSESAAYGTTYFGGGPDAPVASDDPANWLAPVSAGGGLLLLAPAWSCGAPPGSGPPASGSEPGRGRAREKPRLGS